MDAALDDFMRTFIICPRLSCAMIGFEIRSRELIRELYCENI